MSTGPKVQLTLDSRVRIENINELARSEELLADLKDAFTHANPVHAKSLNMGFKPTEPPVIDTYRLELPRWQSGEHFDTSMSVPRGGLQRVRGVLQKHGLRWRVDDRRSSGLPDLMHGQLKSCLVMREHQEAMIAAAKRTQNCLLRSPGASGKTTAVLEFIAREHLPAIIVLWNSQLLKQWATRIQHELGFDPGLVQGQRWHLKQITLAMQQTLWRLGDAEWEALTRSFGIFVMDEVQRASARTFVDVVDRFPAKYRIGMSGDERRRDGKHFLTHDLFGEVAQTIDRDLMTKSGITMDVSVYVIPTEFEAPWYVRAAQRVQKYPRPDFNKLLNQMTLDERRNATLHHVIEHAQREGPTIVFSHRVEHCRRISKVLYACNWQNGLMLGGPENSDESAHTARRLAAGTARIGVGTYQAVGTGIDIPAVSRLVFSTPVHTNQQQWDQYKWRAARTAPGKEDARVYVLWDRKVFGRKPLVNILRWSKDVKVRLSNGRWADGKEYLKKSKTRKDDNEKESGSIDLEQIDQVTRDLEGIFKRFEGSS